MQEAELMKPSVGKISENGERETYFKRQEERLKESY
jgi:hypothetical protein